MFGEKCQFSHEEGVHIEQKETEDIEAKKIEKKNIPMKALFGGYDDVRDTAPDYKELAPSPSSKSDNGEGDILDSFDKLPGNTCLFEEVTPSTSERCKHDKVKDNEDKPGGTDTTTPSAACKNVRFYLKVPVKMADKHSDENEELERMRSAISNNLPDSFHVMRTPMGVDENGIVSWSS